MHQNQDYARNLLETFSILIKNAGHLLVLGMQGEYAAFEGHARNLLEEMQRLIDQHGESFSLPQMESIMDTLKRIMIYAQTSPAKACAKIEFELVPLLQEFYKGFYFFQCVYPEKGLMEKYYQQEMAAIGANKYIDNAIKTGAYKYDVSIVVWAYNKLEYTKMCVESLLKHIPQDLSYELILVNHGSTDGTKEYFESVAPAKQLDILVNGGGAGAFTRICEGKYFLHISNDVLVTQNAIANMIRCMESDEKIAWVVPSTPNVSNFQVIPADYDGIDEMYAFAAKNNQYSDPYRWEQRVRLCDPISLRRADISFSSGGVSWPSYLYTGTTIGFSDDKEALLYRRHGYKLMLAKDSYCYHFGSITVRDEITKPESFYAKGRKEFFDHFGVDPWGIGMCWSPELLALLPFREQGHVNILGLNCGLGGNPLKVKESLKENAHNLDVTLYNVTDDQRYEQDLRGVSDIVVCEPHRYSFPAMFSGVQFTYIVFETGLESLPDPLDTLESLKARLSPNGYLVFQARDEVIMRTIAKNYPAAARANNWCVIPAQGDEYYRQFRAEKDRLAMKRQEQLKSLLDRGEELFEQGNVEMAITIFKSVLSLDSMNSRALNNLGVIQWQQGDVEAAMDIFQAALRFNPDDPDALANFQHTVLETKRFDLVKPDLMDLLKKSQPDNPDFLTLMQVWQAETEKHEQNMV